jgi:hypothetical protein
MNAAMRGGLAGRGCRLEAVLCLVLTVAIARLSWAQDPEPETEHSVAEWAGVSGSIRAGYWTSTRSLDSEEHLGAGMVWLKSTRPVSPRGSFLIEGWTALRGPAGDADARGELREAFADLRFGRLDVRVGRQIVAWGRADGINPTDNVTGEDLTLLTPDDEDRRFGATAVRASYYTGGTSVTALWVPEFRAHHVPLPPAPGVGFIEDAPDWPGNQWAIRVEQTGRKIDGSMSYFQGHDLAPDVQPGRAPGVSTSEGIVVLSHRRIRAVGADLAATLGRIGVRAEGAYVHTEDGSGRDPFTKNPHLFIVAGGDRTFLEYLNLNVQYVYRFVRHHRPPGDELSDADRAIAMLQDVLSSQTRRVQHGASFRLSYKWLRETLEGECAAAGLFGPDGLAVRPKLAYALSDSWKLLAGAEWYRGESTSLFGVMRPNSTGYLELRWTF